MLTSPLCRRITLAGGWLAVLLAICVPQVLNAQMPLGLGDWYPVADLELMYDDNINRSIDGSGEKGDLVIAPQLSLLMQRPLAHRWAFTGQGYVQGTIHGQYNKLNYLAPGLEAGFSYALGDTPRALLLRAQLGLRYEFHEQDFRFGAEMIPRLSAEFGLGAQLYAALYYEYDNRFASEEEIYDREGHTFGFTVDLELAPEYGVELGYAYRRGDVLVHQPTTTPAPNIRGEVFPVDNTFKSRFAALKFEDQDQHHLYVGAYYALSLYTTVNFRVAYEQIDLDDDTVASTQFRLALSHLL